MYEFKSRVRYSEIDPNQKLTLEGILNYFQDCSTFHSEDIGLGMEYLKKKNIAWLLSSWQIVVEEYPGFGEEITIATWAYDFNNFYGSRNFAIINEKGEKAAYANSVWIFMDTKSGRPVRITEEELKGYQIEERLEMSYEPRKVMIPKEREIIEAFPIRRSNIDTNYHVNNGQYIQMAKEYIPEDFAIHQMRAEYKKSAVLGDIVVPGICKGENAYTVSLCDESDRPYAVVEFK